MTLRNRYRLLGSRALRKGFLKEIVFPLLFGILIGFLLGKLRGEDGGDLHRHKYVKKIKLDEYEYPDGSIFFLRCLVLVHPDAKKPLNFIMSIRDTYKNQCNQTFFYTTSPEIHKKVKDQNIFLIQSGSNAFYWNFFKNTLNHSSIVPAMWTIVMDEQIFLKVSNLRRALMNFDFKEKVIIGRVLESKISHFFPFISNTRLAFQAGIVMSNSALHALLSCEDFLLPQTTEKTIITCSEKKEIPIVDPVDEDGMHLFHYKDFKSLIPQGKDGDHSCCSDHAISFGQQSFKEILMAHYASERWAVFGVNGVLEVNSTYAIDRKFLVKQTIIKTTKKPKQTPKKTKETKKKAGLL